jgi:hypothetical protein
LRQKQSGLYPRATLSGSRVFQLSSTARIFRIAVSRVKGGTRLTTGFDCVLMVRSFFYISLKTSPVNAPYVASTCWDIASASE